MHSHRCAYNIHHHQESVIKVTSGPPDIYHLSLEDCSDLFLVVFIRDSHAAILRSVYFLFRGCFSIFARSCHNPRIFEIVAQKGNGGLESHTLSVVETIPDIFILKVLAAEQYDITLGVFED